MEKVILLDGSTIEVESNILDEHIWFGNFIYGEQYYTTYKGMTLGCFGGKWMQI